MNSTTAILIAMALALLLLAAFYGVSSSVVDSGSDAIDNFSSRAESDDENISFASTNSLSDKEIRTGRHKVNKV